MDVFKAGLPNLIACSNCKSKIKFNINNLIEYPIIIILIFAVMGAAYFTGSYINANDILPFKNKHVMFGAFISFALVLEIAFTFWLLKIKKVVG
jgi:hypothetical protein